MKKKSLIIFVFIFSLFFCLNIDGVKADNFTLSFGLKSEKISVKISGAPSTDFNTASSIQCEVNVVDEDATVSRCSYIGVSSYYNNSYSFKGNGNVKISNKKKKNNSLRMTKFSTDCKKNGNSTNNYICTISNITFKWEKHDECNSPDRSGNNNGIPGVIACVGGSSIFCDEYKNMKESEIKDKCPGAYDDNNSLTVNDVIKKCEILDTAEFDKWCKYGNGKNAKNEEVVDDIYNASDEWNSEDNNSSNENVSCTELLGDENVELISNILFIISIVGVVLVIVLGSADFVKAVVSSDDDALAQAWKKFKVRIISVVILLLLPVLVDFILSFVNDNLRFRKIDVNGDPVGGEITVEVGKASDCS